MHGIEESDNFAAAGRAARNAFHGAVRMRAPERYALEESAYRIVPQEEWQERAPVLHWDAVDRDAARYWTSLAICADAARRLAQLWAQPSSNIAGPPTPAIEERELFRELVELLRDSAAGKVCDELQALDAIPCRFDPVEGDTLELAADCLDVAPYSPAHLAAEAARQRRLLRADEAQRLEAVIAEVEAARD